jgi:hypothetical protein
MAGKVNAYLSKAVKFADRLSGGSARRWKTTSDTLSAEAKGGRKAFTPLHAKRRAKVEAGRSFQARVKATAVGGVVASSGFLGIHKYHQHKDNKILEKIDRMYSVR